MTISRSVEKMAYWVMTILTIPLFVFDVVTHLTKPKQVLDSFEQLGISASLSVPIGIICAVCLVLYLAPRTTGLGAVLFTGYLGGAVITNLRAGAPMANTAMAVTFGAFLWAAAILRQPKLAEVFGIELTYRE